MYYIKMSNKEIEDLKHFSINRKIINTEANFYEFPCHKQLLKLFYCFNDNKYKTIKLLIKIKENIKINELVFPNSLVKINNSINGYTIKKIDGINLSLILSNQNVPLKQKILYLKKIGILLEKLKNIRDSSIYNTFYLNDLHEDNCLVDKNNNINIIDLDSAKLYNDDWYPSKYLCKVRASKLDKYKDNAINQDTDYYCYSIIILNFLLKRKIHYLSSDEFDQYLEYLYKIGFDYSLVNCFSNLYTNVPNENPYKLLDTIDNNIYRANYNTFKANQKHL